MDNELMLQNGVLKAGDIVVEGREISFPSYGTYLEKAKDIAAYIRSTDLTEDNVLEVKHLLADSRRVTDELSSRRILIKKALLQSFTTFEAQVKEISAVISEAEDELRGKVRDLEEAERQVKKETLRSIWEKRSAMYDLPKLLDTAFEVWLEPKHLNKSTSLNKAEADMTAFLEQSQKDIEAARTLGNKVLTYYLLYHDLTRAISAVNEETEIQKKVDATSKTRSVTFVVTGEKDIKLAEMLLNENHINYKRI